ncbi:putative UV-damage endonuclease [Moumouvirus australiensis]|uniref:Putative UV-damage endonuclease n=1 Tax=Moumouvirus australiensis TaxID=2109587 RepID=A0A2P1EL09_9VIRU|nr:putative UV-damage endonuclease [Moumouvirus australiensis]AVL94576.1 putative UV-damage endonuclease [Moumouvirus australiensis]
MDKYPIRIGYACISTELRDYDIFTSRTLILKTAAAKGIDYVKELASNNVDDLFNIIIFNEAHGIRFFRISSCVFPHLGNPQLSENDYELDFVKDKLKIIGKYAKKCGHRLTMHPGQFCQLGSPNEKVIEQSFIDLKNHAKLLQMLGYKPSDGSVLIIHGGGTFGNKKEALERWKNNFLKLPPEIRDYIALENDENSYGIMDLLPFCEELKIPFCVDLFHNRVSKNRVAITKKLMRRIFNTWHVRGIVPKMHISEQQPGLKRGAHSKTLNRLPEYVLRLPSMLKTPLDIMLEVKDKEVSVFKIYYKYFDIHMDETGRVDYSLKKEYEKIEK